MGWKQNRQYGIRKEITFTHVQWGTIYARFQTDATIHPQSFTTWARTQLTDPISVTVTTLYDMKVAEKYWRSISNNINQIAHRVNTKQQADITDLNDIRDQLLSIQRQINDIQYHNDIMILQQKRPARERK